MHIFTVYLNFPVAFRFTTRHFFWLSQIYLFISPIFRPAPSFSFTVSMKAKKYRIVSYPVLIPHILLAVLKIFDFFSCKLSVIAFFKSSKTDITNSNTLKLLHVVTNSFEHFTNLSVLSFVDRNIYYC